MASLPAWHWTWWITKIMAFMIFVSEIQLTPGELILSSSELEPVCEVGASTEVTCSTTAGALRWYITIPRMITESRFMSRNTQSSTSPPLTIDSSTISFTRLSAHGALPLVAVVRIDRVSEALNGTVINCTEVGLNLISPDTSATTVQLVDREYINVMDPPLNVTIRKNSEVFGPESVMLVLEWTASSVSLNVMYLVSFEYENGVVISETHNSSVLVSVPYNTLFNVSITRILTVCNRTLATTNILLSYASCTYPLLKQDIVHVGDYREPLLSGAAVSFSCPPGLALNGPNTTTCMENGEWEPDPSLVSCVVDCGTPLLPKDAYIDSCSAGTTEGTNLSVVCLSQPSYPMATIVCYHEGYWEPNVTELCTPNSTLSMKETAKNMLTIVAIISSLAAFTTGSLLFFLVGYACGRRSTKSRDKNKQEPRENVVYEDIHTQEDKGLELKRNVAYGPVIRL